MRFLNSCALSPAVAVLLLFIALTHPVAAGPISIFSDNALLRAAASGSGSGHVLGDLGGDARLNRTGDSVKIDAALENTALHGNGTYVFTLALLNGELSTHGACASRTLEQSETWIHSTISKPASGPAAPILTPDLGFSTGDLADFAWTLLVRVTEWQEPTGGEQAVPSTDSDSRRTIVVASEPNHLASLIGAGAIGCAWQVRRFRRHRRRSAA